jgi:hypothetical protein
MQGVLARSGGFGAMGHLGHIAIKFKSLGYNIAYSNCIHFKNFLIQLINDPNDPKATFPL